MAKTYIGIDNGVTGSIGLVGDFGAEFYFTPSKKEQDYTKRKKGISRIQVLEMNAILKRHKPSMAIMERPLVNSKMFTATESALRAHEATLIILEANKIPHMFVDSGDWQKVMLPKGCKGKENLKKASLDIGCRLFPQFREMFEKQKDADGMLIAEWARRTNL